MHTPSRAGWIRHTDAGLRAPTHSTAVALRSPPPSHCARGILPTPESRLSQDRNEGVETRLLAEPKNGGGAKFPAKATLVAHALIPCGVRLQALLLSLCAYNH